MRRAEGRRAGRPPARQQGRQAGAGPARQPALPHHICRPASQHPPTLPPTHFPSRSFGRFFYRFPNGESGADVYDRCARGSRGWTAGGGPGWLPRAAEARVLATALEVVK